MKCPNCGAEIGNTKFCEYCGSQITADMQKEQEQLKKKGCPKCGSSNITFKRENQGEVRNKNSKKVIHRTVGVCKDCGTTWYADGAVKKRKTWLWVLGWIFIFPLPLTLILWKKKDMNNILKYGIIAVAWIAYIVIAISGMANKSDTATTNSNTETFTTVAVAETTTTETTTAETKVKADSIEIVAGEMGEYGKEVTMSKGTDQEEKLIVYYVPAGKYTVKNLGNKPTQVSVYEGFAKNAETGYDEYTNTGSAVLVDKGKEAEIEVPDGWFIEVQKPTHISLTENK